MTAIDKSAQQLVRSFVERIERLEDEVKAINSDKSDVYKEAKSKGLDTKALKSVIARRRKDPSELDVQEALVQQYELALEPAGESSSRARAREEAPTHVS
jgi:uncharacterized protein (UPF0335 family)